MIKPIYLDISIYLYPFYIHSISILYLPISPSSYLSQLNYLLDLFTKIPYLYKRIKNIMTHSLFELLIEQLVEIGGGETFSTSEQYKTIDTNSSGVFDVYSVPFMKDEQGNQYWLGIMFNTKTQSVNGNTVETWIDRGLDIQPNNERVMTIKVSTVDFGIGPNSFDSIGDLGNADFTGDNVPEAFKTPGSYMKIMNTVAAYIKKYIAERKPQIIRAEGNTVYKPNQSSNQKTMLYQKYASRMISSIPGWDFVGKSYGVYLFDTASVSKAK